MNKPCNTTHNLRNKLKDFLKNPLLDDESWVPLCQIEDEEEGEPRITVIFGTNKTLENLKFSETFHCDATYRLTWHRYPVFVCGVTNETGKFSPALLYCQVMKTPSVGKMSLSLFIPTTAAPTSNTSWAMEPNPLRRLGLR